MNKLLQTSVKLAIVTGGAAMLIACQPASDGGATAAAPELEWPVCGTVDNGSVPRPHLEDGDRFCVEFDGTDYVLNPSTGLDEWQSTTGTSDIPLTFIFENPARIFLGFDVQIVGHSNTDHGPVHSDIGGYFNLAINKYTSDMDVTRGGPPGGPVHGGSAHLSFD